MLPASKRVLDVILVGLTAPLWLPLLAVLALLNLVFSGRPVWYASLRRVDRHRTIPVLKFRTMIRNADKVANRDTVPIEGTAFLNIPRNSPLYTRMGKLLERLSLNELPQLIHVLTGEMTLVGNRPLPENVITALAARYGKVEDRFATPAGATGLVQLVGRDGLSDANRLRLEADYCRACQRSYSIMLDLVILASTVGILLGLRQPFTFDEAEGLLVRYHGVTEPPVIAPIQVSKRERPSRPSLERELATVQEPETS
jgi:lipopolysaccharide/colanic/teichoic acid biosynthesis glycosyltransferase